MKADLADWMLTVPNIPDASVPDGVDENDNVEVHRWVRRASLISK